MVMQWSTESVPAATRFDEWHAACSEHVYALTAQHQTHQPFHGAIERHHLGALDVTDIACDGHLVQRREQDIDADPGDTYYIYLQRRGRAWFEQRGHRWVAEAGDIVIGDPNLPFSTGVEDRFDFRLWRIQREHLRPLLALSSGELPMLRIGHEHAERHLITGWLDGLLNHHTDLMPHNLDLAVSTLCALLASSAGAAPEWREHGQQARRHALLLRVKQWVEQRAGDMGLKPQHAASAFGLSLRTLHQLFALSDCSFQTFLTRARLARAHRLLRDPAASHLGTVDIGFAAGFGEVSTFYRRFKHHYGMTPGEWREG